MTKKRPAGSAGKRGPAGPRGPRGSRGERGERGLKGTGGARLVLGPDADPKRLIKALDIQVEGIYRELSSQMNHLARVQRQLDDVRAAIKHLNVHHRTSS